MRKATIDYVIHDFSIRYEIIEYYKKKYKHRLIKIIRATHDYDLYTERQMNFLSGYLAAFHTGYNPPIKNYSRDFQITRFIKYDDEFEKGYLKAINDFVIIYNKEILKEVVI